MTSRKKITPIGFRIFNKKGETEASDANIPAIMLYYMLASLIILIVIGGFAAILAGWQSGVANFPNELRADAIALRFTQNPDCFVYQDEVSKKVYPGIIDLSKFNEGRIDTCYPTGEDGYEFFQYELYLKEYDLTLATDNYFNVIDDTIEKQILVYDEGKFELATLFIYVQDKI